MRKRYSEQEIINLLRSIEVKRCKGLEKENGHLRRIVSDLELDKSMLKAAPDFSGHRG